MTSYFSKQPDWTKEEIQEVASYLRAGWTSAEIASRMGMQSGTVLRRIDKIAALDAIGFNRSAMASRQLRGLLSKAGQLENLNAFKDANRPADAKEYDANSLFLPLRDLGSQDCVWPVNNPPVGGTHLFCGHNRMAGVRYCAHHEGRRNPAKTRFIAEAA